MLVGVHHGLGERGTATLKSAADAPFDHASVAVDLS